MEDYTTKECPNCWGGDKNHYHKVKKENGDEVCSYCLGGGKLYYVNGSRASAEKYGESHRADITFLDERISSNPNKCKQCGFNFDEEYATDGYCQSCYDPNV